VQSFTVAQQVQNGSNLFVRNKKKIEINRNKVTIEQIELTSFESPAEKKKKKKKCELRAK
jgi:hypothetical protein